MDKKESRLRRSRRARAKISELGAHRLSVHRTGLHIYAQIIAPEGDKVIASASTLQAPVKGGVKYSGNSEAAAAVGKAVAEAAKSNGVEKVVFDRGGYLYHGRVKALADGAREAGLKF